MPVSAVDSIRPAFEHTKKQTFERFRSGQWLRLAVVGLLSSAPGGCGLNFSPFRGASSPSGLSLPPALRNPSLLFVLIPVLAVLTLAIGIVLMYVGSRMYFVLFDSVLERECRIREFWRRRREQGFRYFVFQLLFFLVAVSLGMILVGIPLLAAFLMGFFSSPRDHLFGLIGGGAALLFLVLVLVLAVVVVGILTKDFVVPQMALENKTVLDGWRRLWSMMQAEMRRYAGYLGMKVVLSIVASIAVGILGFAVLLVMLVPLGTLGLTAVLGGNAAGLTWNFFTISTVAISALIFFAAAFCVTSFLSVPLIVFFPAYSIHFFAGRYPPLAQRVAITG